MDLERAKTKSPEELTSIWDDFHLGRGHIGITIKLSFIDCWSNEHPSVQAPHMIFTQAAPYLTSTFYSELSETKDLVFIRGDVVFTSKITDEEAKWIMETAQSFYLNDNRYKLLERFNKHTHDFEFKDVLQVLDMLVL